MFSVCYWDWQQQQLFYRIGHIGVPHPVCLRNNDFKRSIYDSQSLCLGIQFFPLF